MPSRYGFEQVDGRREEALAQAAAESERRERDAAREKLRRLLSRIHWVVVDILNDYRQAAALPGEVRHTTEIDRCTPARSPLTGGWGFRETPAWELRAAQWAPMIGRAGEQGIRRVREDVFVRVSLNLSDIDVPSLAVQVHDSGRGQAADDRNRRRLLEVLGQKTGLRAHAVAASHLHTGGGHSPGYRGR